MNYKIERPKKDLSTLIRYKDIGYGQIFAIGDIYSSDDTMLCVKTSPILDTIPGVIRYNAICLDDGVPLKVGTEIPVSVYSEAIKFDVTKFVTRGAK